MNEREQRVPVREAQQVVPADCARRLAAVQPNRLIDRLRTTIVQIETAESQSP